MSGAEQQPDAPEVDVETFADALAGGADVIDVREPDEYADAHIPGWYWSRVRASSAPARVAAWKARCAASAASSCPQ